MVIEIFSHSRGHGGEMIFFPKMILHAPPFFGDQKFSITEKGGGMCYYFGKKKFISPVIFLWQPKNVSHHLMVRVCQTVIENFRLPSNTPS
jgi:hypothetical protein